MNLWTDEQKEMLRAQYDAGTTFKDIADAINARFGTAYTRNAAISRAHRMKLPPRPSPIREKAEEPKPKKVVRKPKFKADPFKSRTVKVVSLRKTIVEVAFTGECKWADDEPNDAGQMTFCGNRTAIGSSWCELHHKLVWWTRAAPARQRPFYRERRAA